MAGIEQEQQQPGPVDELQTDDGAHHREAGQREEGDWEQIAAEDVRTIREAVAKMLAPGESVTSGFPQRYLAALQADPAVVIAHTKVRRILDAR